MNVLLNTKCQVNLQRTMKMYFLIIDHILLKIRLAHYFF